MQLARAQGEEPLKRRFVLPPAVPPFNTTIYRMFSFFWVAVFLLALAGPPVGFTSATRRRPTIPSCCSAAVPASPCLRRTQPPVRFPSGPHAGRAGIKAGDHIVAVYGLPLPAKGCR